MCARDGCKDEGRLSISYLIVTPEGWICNINRKKFCCKHAAEFERRPSLVIPLIREDGWKGMTTEKVKWHESKVEAVKPVTVYATTAELTDMPGYK